MSIDNENLPLEFPPYRYTLPRHRTKLDYVFYVPRLLRSYFARLLYMCHLRFLLFLIISQFLVKGVLYRMTMSSMLPIFKQLGIGASDLQIYMAVAMSPWTLKPLVGVLSDVLVIRGYHKRYWLLQAALVGTVAAALTFPTAHAPMILVLCFIGINYEMAIVDVLTEGRYAETMQLYPESGSDIVTFVNGAQTLGSIVAMSFVGVLADNQLFWVIFFFAIVLCLTPLVPSGLGWLPEERQTPTEGQCVRVDREIFHANQAVFVLVAFTGFAAPGVAFLSTYTNRVLGLVCAALVLGGALLGMFMAFPRSIARVGLYLVVVRLAKPSIGTALDYYFTADAQCLPDGPHFSFKYYITYTGITSSCVAFVAVWIYQSTLSGWRFRNVVLFTTLLDGFGGLSDLLIVLRVNRRLGISDHAFYMVGEAVFETMVDMLYWIPLSVIISKVCEPGVESATYAFLAGLGNFAQMVGELSGALIFEAAGVGKCSFDALWWLVLCFHILLPIIVGVPAAYLIPNKDQNAYLLENDQSTQLVREDFIDLTELDAMLRDIDEEEEKEQVETEDF